MRKLSDKIVTVLGLFFSITLHAALFTGINYISGLNLKFSDLTKVKCQKEIVYSVETINANDLPDIKKLGRESKIPQKEGQEKQNLQNSEMGLNKNENQVISDKYEKDAMLRFEDMVKLKIQKARKYPELAKKRGIEGSVMLSFELYQNGNLGEVKIIESSNTDILDNEAVNTIKRAIPFPKIPEYYKMQKMNLQVKIIYKLN